LTDINSNLSSVHGLTGHLKSSIGFLAIAEVDMPESSAVTFLVLCDSDSQNISVFRESLLEGGFFSSETEISDEKSAGVSGLRLLEILTFFTVLGLFDVQPTSHMLGFVIL
jgi:hypothetical protein